MMPKIAGAAKQKFLKSFRTTNLKVGANINATPLGSVEFCNGSGNTYVIELVIEVTFGQIFNKDQYSQQQLIRT